MFSRTFAYLSTNTSRRDSKLHDFKLAAQLRMDYSRGELTYIKEQWIGESSFPQVEETVTIEPRMLKQFMFEMGWAEGHDLLTELQVIARKSEDLWADFYTQLQMAAEERGFKLTVEEGTFRFVRND